MKIKQLLLLLLIITPFLTIYGQKVKVKKEVLSIDKIEVGYFVEKKVYEKQKQFAVLNLKRDTIFKVGREVVFSPIDGESEIYLYESLTVPNKNLKLNYPIGDGYYLNSKSIIRHFMSIGLIDKDLNLDEDKLSTLEQSLDKFPKDIAAVLEKEKQEMNNLDFIADKIEDGQISLKKLSSTSEMLQYLYRPNKYYFDTYEVYSSKDDEKLLVGKVVFRSPLKSASLDELKSKGPSTLAGDQSKSIIFVYNNKGGRVARLAKQPFGKLNVYKKNTVENAKEHNLFEEKSILGRATKLVNKLITQGVL